MGNMPISKETGRNVSSKNFNITIVNAGRVQQKWSTDYDQDHILP